MAARQLTRYPVTYREVASKAGLSFKHSNGGSGHRYYLETTGAGCAFLDYNNDGWPDVFMVQSGPLPEVGHGLPPRNALYRNQGNGTFKDVTVEAGLAASCGYGQGVAVADFNNDGYEDILVTSYGQVHLFQNQGNGTFRDITSRAGLVPHSNHPVWSTSAAWGDYDNDGYLDLVICRYVKWTPQTDADCPQPDGKPRGTCPPQVYDPDRCALYHNNKNGTFTDVSERSGVARVPCKGLGVAWVDYDGDGREDFLVASDGSPNVLFHNQGDGTFRNRAVEAGVAYGENGDTYNGMGIALADVRHSGHEDIVIANFAGQPKSVFYNLGDGTFRNATIASGIGRTSRLRLGFGCAFLDYDLDGWPDLAVANGHVSDLTSHYTPGATYEQPAQLFHNNGNGTFTEDHRSAGDLEKPWVSRGMAIGDLNNDGAPDILVNHMNGQVGLYQNVGGSKNHWITLRFEGRKSNRDGIGAKVWLQEGNVVRYGEVRGDASYCSHNCNRLSFGLGACSRVDEVKVRWPGGAIQRCGPLASDGFYLVTEGAGVVREPRLQRRTKAAASGSLTNGGVR